MSYYKMNYKFNSVQNIGLCQPTQKPLPVPNSTAPPKVITVTSNIYSNDFLALLFIIQVCQHNYLVLLIKK